MEYLMEHQIIFFINGQTKKNFDEVLSDAKKLGYAESNPSADLNGDDVSSKLKILSSLMF